MIRRAAVVLSASLTAACGVASRAPDSTPALAGTSPAASPDLDPRPITPADPHETRDPSELADDVVARSLVAVSSIRQLAAKGPVRARVLSRSEMVDHVASKLRTDVPPEVVLAHRELLVLLGVVPIDFDYEHDLLSLMSSQLAGFYEPEDDTMYLASDLGGVDGRATLSHELVHALQDQHYDLGEKIRFTTDGSDRQAALHALAEGDAMSAMLDDMLATAGQSALDISDALLAAQVHAGMALDASAAAVPEIIKNSLVAPYVDGTIFVHALRRRGGWAEVDRVWADPPSTTEQVLHTDKLATREPALPVAVPMPPAADFSTLYHDVLGEQSLVLTLDAWLPRAPSERAAAGWGGDRVGVYRSNRRFAFAWRIDFDSGDDAKEAHAAFEAAARGAVRGCVERDDRGPLALARRGRSVAIVGGPYTSDGAGSRSESTCVASQLWLQRVLGSP